MYQKCLIVSKIFLRRCLGLVVKNMVPVNDWVQIQTLDLSQTVVGKGLD